MDKSMEELLLLAGSLYSNGQYQEALQTYRETTQKWPENGIIRSNLSALLLKVGRVEEAIEEGKEAVRLSPHWFKTHYRLGECHRMAGDHLDALLSYSKALSIDHSNPLLIESCLQSAIVLFKDHFPLASLRRTQQTSNAVSILVCIGQCLLQQGELRASREILLYAHSLSPPSFAVHSSLLSSLISVSSLLSHHESALGLAKEYFQLCNKQGVCVVSSLEWMCRESECMGDIEGSLTARLLILQSIQQDDPSRFSHILQSADLYLSLEMIDEAAESFTSVLIGECSVEDRVRARAGLAFTVFHRGENREAIRLIEDLEMAEMDEKLGLRLMEFKCLAMIREGTFDPSAVCKLLDDAHLPSTAAKLSFILAQYFVSTGNVESALKMVKKALGIAKKMEDFPLQASSLILLSQIYELNVDCASALSLLEHCIRLPKVPMKERLVCLHGMSSLLERMGRLEDAMERVKEAVKMSREKGNEKGLATSETLLSSLIAKKDKEIESSITQVDQRNNQSEILQQKLVEAQEMNNEVDESSICLSLGKIYEEEEQLEEALHYYQQALTVSKQLRLVQMMGSSYLGLARVLARRGEWKRVETCARASLTMGGLIGDDLIETEAMILIGKRQMNKGDTDLAKRVFLKVLRRMDEKGEKTEREERAIIHFDVARISDNESSSSHFWRCYCTTERVELKIECLLHLSSIASPSNPPHSLLRAAIAYTIGENKMESLLRLSRRERELRWMIEAVSISSFAIHKYSHDQNYHLLIDELSSFPPPSSTALLLSLYSNRQDTRILFRLFTSLPHFVIGQLDNDQKEETQVLRYLCHSLMGEEVEEMNSLPDGDWTDLIGFSLPSYINQIQIRRDMIKAAPFRMVERIECMKIDEIMSDYDSLLLELTHFDCLLPPFAISSFSFCTLLLSIFIPSINNLLHILDLADWVLAGHGVAPPSSATVPSTPFTRLFSCGCITIIWSSTDGKSICPSYFLSSSPSCPMEETLLSLLQSQSIPHSPTLIFPQDSILIGFPPIDSHPTTMPSSHVLSLSPPPTLTLNPPSSSILIIDLDQVTPLTAPVRVSRDQSICPSLLIHKILSSDVVIMPTDSVIRRLCSPLLLSSSAIHRNTNTAPSLFILTHLSLPSSFIHSLIYGLFARGTKTVIILRENPSTRDVERIINEIVSGEDVDLPSILPIHSIIIGQRVFTPRLCTAETLRMSLRRGCLTSDSPTSSFVSTLLNVVVPSTLDNFLHLPLDSKELNETYSRLKKESDLIREKDGGNSMKSDINLFNVIFTDHLFTMDDPLWESELSDLPSALSLLHPPDMNDEPISRPPSEWRGYESEGDNGRNETCSFPSQGKYCVSATDGSTKRRKRGKEGKRSASVNQSSRVPLH